MTAKKKRPTAAETKAKAEAERQHAEKITVQRRIDDVVRIRLDGAEFRDLCEFVREKEGEVGSAWLLADGASPLSDSQIRRYQQRADGILTGARERSRKKAWRRHLAQRRHLYARAATSGDLGIALRCLQDEATMLGLYPSTKVKVKSKGRLVIELVEFGRQDKRDDEEAQ
jgi:hypothetical protein